MGMALDAIAILHVPPTVVHEALPASKDDAALRVGKNGEPVRVVPLADAVCVHLGVPLASEPDALADRLDDLLEDLLDVHDDARGVPVYPSTYALAAKSWAEALDELGEAADWIDVDAELDNPMAALLGGLGGGDMAAMMQQMQGLGPGGDPAAMMETAMKMMGQLAESGALADLAKAMSGAMPATDPRAALEQLGGAGMDLDALTKQAQAMLDEDPELERKLRESLAASGDDEAPDEDDEG